MRRASRWPPSGSAWAAAWCGNCWRRENHSSPAAVPFYGPLPDGADFSGSKDVAVLAFYGSKDGRVTGTKDAAQQALDKAGLVNQLVVEQGADHAFFNDTGERYDPTAAADAWQKTQDSFTKYVG